MATNAKNKGWKMSKNPGRPANKKDVRFNLLQQARSLFAEKGYTKVTTRMIAQAADTDAAMIRYYFGNKESLFRAVLKETVEPLLARIRDDKSSGRTISPDSFITSYYSLLAEAPELPKLIFRSIHDPDAAEHGMVNDVFRQLMAHKATQLKNSIENNVDISASFDAMHVLISTISLSVFPFLLPNDLKEELGIVIDKAFLTELGKHHGLLLKHGIANKDIG